MYFFLLSSQLSLISSELLMFYFPLLPVSVGFSMGLFVKGFFLLGLCGEADSLERLALGDELLSTARPSFFLKSVLPFEGICLLFMFLLGERVLRGGILICFYMGNFWRGGI